MTVEHARALRKNMTDAERALWGRLNRRQMAAAKFRRQQILGTYIVDFVALFFACKACKNLHRLHRSENAKFVSNARGSLYETLDHLTTAADENFIPEAILKTGCDLVTRAARIVNGYMEYLKRAAYASAPKPQPSSAPNNQ